MKEFFDYLKQQNTELKVRAEELQKEDRRDEANLLKVRANIYEVCETVCREHMNRPEGQAEACRTMLARFAAQWGSEQERAKSRGDTEKAVIEEIKLEALADVRKHFEEAVL